MDVTALRLAQRYLGMKEVVGARHNPMVVAMLRRFGGWIDSDEEAWCGAFVGHFAFELDLPCPKGAAALSARQWLTVGEPVPLGRATPGWDIVVLKRGGGHQPGPEVTKGAPGHVGFFVAFAGGLVPHERLLVLGGNQGNAVTVAEMAARDVLGVRRLWRAA